MQFAIIGDHPDGLSMARALVELGHDPVIYAGSSKGAEELRGQLGRHFKVVQDVEELLAERTSELVIVAADLERRPEMLRRAVQSDKHVLCVHPIDLTPDIAYEAAMIQQDTRKLLLPLLTDRFAPGQARLRQLCRDGAFGKLQLVEIRQALPISQPGGQPSRAEWEHSPLLSVWDSLRSIVGEIREVSALALAIGTNGGAEADSPTPLSPFDPITLAGRFEHGELFQVVLAAGDDARHAHILVRGGEGSAELISSSGLNGPSQLVCMQGGNKHVEEWPASDPWRALAAAFQQALAGEASSVSWLDGIRCLELFDAAKTSVKRRRVVPMNYEAMSETATFKGIMIPLGCGVLWGIILILIAAVWIPWVGYLILPLLLLFLALQLLRWVVPQEGRNRQQARGNRQQ